MKLKPIRGTLCEALRIYDCPELLRDHLAASLTYANPAYEQAQRFSPWENSRIPRTVCLLTEYPDYVEIPRGIDWQLQLSDAAKKLWHKIRWEDHRSEFNVKFPPRRLQLNNDQRALQSAFLKSERNKERPFGNYLMVVPTSGGKTIAQALLAETTGQRTLVLCKTNLIKTAWQEDLFKLYGFNLADLGSIQQKTFRVGEHFTLASIATLSRRKALWQELFSSIGCLVIDECQLVGADTIREIVAACPAKYIIGMTATDTRRDGKTYLVRNLLGKAVKRIHNKQEETESSLPLADARIVPTNYRYLDDKGQPVDRLMLDFTAMVTQMTQDAARNRLIAAEAVKDWRAGHCVLVATPRVDHAEALLKEARLLGVREANLLTGETNADRTYTDKLLASIFAGHCRFLVASLQAVKLGANINPLDRLHLAIPPSNKSDLEQIIGRIRRKHKNKKDAQLTWYYDVLVPYWVSKHKSVFYPVMRKLRVPRYVDLFVA